MDMALVDIFSDGLEAEYIHDVAQTKRFLELWSMEPGFREAFSINPEKVLNEKGLHEVDVLSMRILSEREMAIAYSGKAENEIPVSVRRYRHFIKEKFRNRDYITRHLCVPTDNRFRFWRQRQINRCWMELGSRNAQLIHTPMTFELAVGCSVGCPFCGVAAKSLSKIAFYKENKDLWRGILACVNDFIGTAAGSGTCYYATEPLDNSDYELYIEDFYDEFGMYPQLTTATAMRDPERTKRLLQHMRKKYFRIHRFSVLSLQIFHDICAAFTSEELLEVELLPQFPEAPACCFSNVGRAREWENNEKVQMKDEGATIACITGFVVNLAEKSMRLITPGRIDAEHPTGEEILAKETFEDVEDFDRKMRILCQKYMPESINKNDKLQLLRNLKWRNSDKGVCFEKRGDYKFSIACVENGGEVFRQVFRLLDEGCYTEDEIVEKLFIEQGLDPAELFFTLHQIYKSGLLRRSC